MTMAMVKLLKTSRVGREGGAELAYAPQHRKHDGPTSVSTSAVRPPGLQVLERLSAKERPKLGFAGDTESTEVSRGEKRAW